MNLIPYLIGFVAGILFFLALIGYASIRNYDRKHNKS